MVYGDIIHKQWFWLHSRTACSSLASPILMNSLNLADRLGLHCGWPGELQCLTPDVPMTLWIWHLFLYCLVNCMLMLFSKHVNSKFDVNNNCYLSSWFFNGHFENLKIITTLHPWFLTDIIYCDLKLKFFQFILFYFHALHVLATVQLSEYKSEAHDIHVAMKFLLAQFSLAV